MKKTVLFLLLTSCGSNSHKEEINLVGTSWESQCIHAGETVHYTMHLSFANSLKRKLTHFVDNKCAVAWGEYEETSNYSVSANKLSTESVSIDYTIKSSGYLNYFNAAKVFEISDWKVDETRNVTGKVLDDTFFPKRIEAAINGDTIKLLDVEFKKKC